MDVLRRTCLGIALLAGPLLGMPRSASGAPFVLGAPRPLAIRIANARAAVIATPAPKAGPNQWRIDCCLHDPAGAVKPGETIRPKPAPSLKHPAVLLISRKDRVVECIPLRRSTCQYLEDLPMPDNPQAECLKHAFAHLNDADPRIAEDAFARLAQFSAGDFKIHRRALPVDTLRKLVKSSETPADHVGLFAYLLGLGGRASDAELVLKRIEADDEGPGTALPGLFAGYLLLAGQEGLGRLEGDILMAERRSPIVVAAFYEALQTLVREHPERFPGQRAIETAKCGLHRTDAADLAIGFLASQRAWKALPEVAGLLTPEDPEPVRRRAVQITAVRFLLACQRDPGAPAARRAQAGRLLEQIAHSDVDLIRRAERIAGQPAPRN